ncbi:MAG TPA: YetF domain-containing protein [Acidobacteriaceae bacterium]
MLQSMFHLPLPILEKILRPIIVYLFLIGFLRIFGKRELAQLNPFDLVVLLSLSNTVQNAIIGEDNSVSGGIIGAFALLAVNWIVNRLLYKSSSLTEVVEGKQTTLIRHGVVDEAALKAETLTHEELLSVLHKQNVNHFGEVEKCTLEPNGSFYVETIKPSASETSFSSLKEQLTALTEEVRKLRADLAAKG